MAEARPAAEVDPAITNFTPREYQVELLEKSLKKNIIVCLGTGSGKTFIAVMLIKELVAEVRVPYKDGGKRTFFLAKTVPLVKQQASYIRLHTCLNVGEYIGANNVDQWNANVWKHEMDKNQVFVMTPQILTNCVTLSFIKPSDMNLLIIDECHHAVGEDATVQLMRRFQDFPSCEHPRILGLTASVLNGKCKPHQVLKKIHNLEKVLDSTVETASNTAMARLHSTDPEEKLVECRETNDYDEYMKGLSSVLYAIKDTLPGDDKTEEGLELEEDDHVVILGPSVKLGSLLKDLIYILETLGLWCAYHLAIQLLSELKKLTLDIPEEYQEFVTVVMDGIERIVPVCEELFRLQCQTDVEAVRKFSSHKVNRLLDVLEMCKEDVVSDDDYDMLVDAFTEDIESVASGGDSDSDADSESSGGACARPEGSDRAQPDVAALKAIVFVERRTTAWVLCKFLQTVSDFDPNFNFIKPENVMGHGCDPARLGYAQMKVKQQNEKIRNFRSNICNVLVATRVVEEGMDIPTCNVVIRFDEPKDFRSYVQSKGRARSKKSHYIIFANESCLPKLTAEMKLYQSIEKALEDICHDRKPPTEEEITERLKHYFLEPYYVSGRSGPCVTMGSAIALVNRYCALLPKDKFTQLAPKVRFQNMHGPQPADPTDLVDLYDEPDDIYDEFDFLLLPNPDPLQMKRCILWLPINSPVRGPITGEQMPTKKLAKQAVALEACKLLHRNGELNDNLLPVGKDQSRFLEKLTDIEEETVEAGLPKPGTTKRRQVYPKITSPLLKDAYPEAGKPCYVYRIQTTVCNPKLLRKVPKVYDPDFTCKSFGIMTSVPLPDFESFPLHTRMGEMQVDLVLVMDAIVIQPPEIERLQAFHRYLFTEVLQACTFPMRFSPDTADMSLYVVPLVDLGDANETFYFFDYSLVDEVLTTTVCLELMPEDQRRQFTFDKNQYVGSVVVSLHNAARIYSIVEEVWDSVNCRHPFPHPDYRDFVHYYKQKYGVRIQNDRNPLLQVKVLTDCPNLLPEKLSRTRKDKMMVWNGNVIPYVDLFVPELCALHPMPASLWLKAQCIPSILHRLNCLLVSKELAEDIERNAPKDVEELLPHAKWSGFERQCRDGAICHEFTWAPRDTIPRGLLRETPDGQVIPAPSIILEAMTTRACNDCINLERLEIIGDSYLKYAATLYLFCEFPTADEGKLTSGRSRLVSNNHLYHLGKRRNINRCVLVDIFSPRTRWVPPCYVVDEAKEELLLESGVPYHSWQQLKDENWESMTAQDVLRLVREKSATEGDAAAANNAAVVVDENVFNCASHQQVADKSVADCIEAIIGAHLVCIGPAAALRFMLWLGIKLLPETDEEEEEGSIGARIPRPMKAAPTAYLNPGQHASAKLLDSFNGFEDSIGYTFRDKSFMVQAFCHPTYSRNQLTDCYQRLEFLGDAVIDYLITWQLFEGECKYSPGDLTDLRSALVNNNTFARLAVRHKFHQYLKAWSPMLFRAIDKFVNLLDREDTDKEALLFINEDDTYEEEEVEVPKALGDVFESVAGAIYLDSGMCLDTVWDVYYRIMGPVIEEFSQHIPKAPVREVYELFPSVKFGKPQRLEREDGDKYQVEVRLQGRNFVGTGKNSKVAKQNAAKCLLRHVNAHRRQPSHPGGSGAAAAAMPMDVA